MRRPARRFSPLNLSVAVLLLLLAIGGFWWRQGQLDSAALTPQTPSSEAALVFDYAGILQEERAEADGRLQALRRRCGVEMAVVTVGALPEDMTIGALARILIERWQIGRNGMRGGILLLMAQEEKLVRLQATAGLADVFSDGFCREIEGKLRTCLSRGQPAEGLSTAIAAVEGRIRANKPPPSR